jgi:hypothetical protein
MVSPYPCRFVVAGVKRKTADAKFFTENLFTQKPDLISILCKEKMIVCQKNYYYNNGSTNHIMPRIKDIETIDAL